MRWSVLNISALCSSPYGRPKSFDRKVARPPNRSPPVNMTLSIAPVVALIAGILILVAPRLLNYIVALYLIITGLLGLFGTGNFHIH
jgi:hypothetical protein